MKNLLIDYKYKKIGWTILIPSTILGLFLSFTDFESLQIYSKAFAVIHDNFFEKDRFFQFIDVNVTNTIVGSLFIIGALLVCFSKERREDEFIANLRLSSLLWAVLVNYILLLLSFIFIYGGAFLTVMIYNMFTVLIIFIIRFNFILYQNSKLESDEK